MSDFQKQGVSFRFDEKQHEREGGRQPLAVMAFCFGVEMSCTVVLIRKHQSINIAKILEVGCFIWNK